MNQEREKVTPEREREKVTTERESKTWKSEYNKEAEEEQEVL